jgi:NAD(P)-dependent dehydrogenase (short-subunit alcohol dehydrogenase family)
MVTGASSGIGYATARQLAREGARVVATARREALLAELEAAIRGEGGDAMGWPADVTSAPDMDGLVTRTLAAFGRLDVIICSAGVGYHGSLEDTPPDHMRRVIDVNLLGTLYAARAALVAMKRQGSGHIIAVSSIVGRRGVGGSSLYAATKAGQVGLIESLRAEFVGSNFHASVVLPVSSATEFHAAMEREFGHGVAGHGPRQSAETVARAIVDCVVRPKAEVYPYGRARWLSIANVLAPAHTDRLVRRFGRKRVALRSDVPPRP